MSVDTLTTCTTNQRSCRIRRKAKRNDLTKDHILPKDEVDFKTPEIKISDDLGLELLEVCDIPKDMLFPGEYNVYLQDKLKSINEENKQLTLLVKTQEEELASLKDKVLAFGFCQSDQGQSPALQGLASTKYQPDMVACRVMDLSKQVCELTAQLEDQRGRCSLAESKLLNLIGSQNSKTPAIAETLASKEAQLKTLNDKLHTTTSKLFESRNRVQQLQQELKNAHKVLLSEVGDTVSIPDLIATGGNNGSWKGRAQQIHLLQLRVADLSDRLRKCCGHRNCDNLSSLCGDGKLSTKEMKTTLEVAQQETVNVKQQLGDTMRKLDAARARIRVLESELSSGKVHLKTLTDKSLRDDELIHLLQGQVCQLEGRLHQCRDEARSELRKTETYYLQLQDDLRMEKQRSMQLLSSLEDKGKQILRLENILFDLKDKEINATRRDSQCGGNAVQPDENSSMSLCTSTAENELKGDNNHNFVGQECTKLLELIATLNKRLEDTRHESDKNKKALRIEKQMVVRLKAKLAGVEMERAGSLSISKRQNAPNRATVALPEAINESKEELQDRNELLQEEVLTLKTRLSCLEQEREDDLRTFSSILGGRSDFKKSP